MIGVVIVVGLILTLVGIFASYDGWHGDGGLESEYFDVSGPTGVIILAIGAIMVIVGAVL